MAERKEISSVTLPDGQTYYLKDETARTPASSSDSGIVLLSDATNGAEGATSGHTAATPKAVSDALTAAKAYADSVGGSSVTIKTWGN